MLVRFAALVAVDAPAVSYAVDAEAADAVGLDAEKLSGVLAAVAPIVGAPRVASATGKIVKALAVAIRWRSSRRKRPNRREREHAVPIEASAAAAGRRRR